MIRKRSKIFLNYDLYGIVKDGNLKFDMSVIFKVEMLALNSFSKN